MRTFICAALTVLFETALVVILVTLLGEHSVFGIVGVAVLVVGGCVVIANAVGRALDYVNREEVVMSVSKRENDDATV